MQREVVQQMRLNSIKQAQDEEIWIANLKPYLFRGVTML